MVFVASPKYGQFWMDDISWLCIYGNISCNGKLSSGTSADVRHPENYEKGYLTFHKVCMQLVREDCLEKDLEQYSSEIGICAGSSE